MSLARNIAQLQDEGQTIVTRITVDDLVAIVNAAGLDPAHTVVLSSYVCHDVALQDFARRRGA